MFISKELLGVIAAALVLVAYIPYIRDIIRRKVLPHPYSWFVWMITTTVIFFIQVDNGSGSGAYMTATVAVLMMVIFILALRYNKSKIKTIDIICLAAACVGIIAWLFVQQPVISIVILLSVELIGFIPTVVKGWQKPYEDSATLWGVNSFRQMSGILAVQSYSTVTILNPLIWIVISLSYFTLLLARRVDVRKPKGRKREFRPYA